MAASLLTKLLDVAIARGGSGCGFDELGQRHNRLTGRRIIDMTSAEVSGQTSRTNRLLPKSSDLGTSTVRSRF